MEITLSFCAYFYINCLILLLLQNTTDNFSEMLEISEELNHNSNRRFSSQPDLQNVSSSCAQACPHSQSLTDFNVALPLANIICSKSITSNLNSRPASIVLADCEGQYKFPTLKLCPSTPTPSESESSASQVPPANKQFPFNQTEKEMKALLPTCSSCSSKPPNTPILNRHNIDSTLGPIDRKTNCNAKKSMLVSFTSNADINTIANSHVRQHHGQHRSLNEINGSGCHASNNNSPNVRNCTSPNTSLLDEKIAATNLAGANTPANRNNKLSPTPSRNTAVATPISFQSQSDSLSSATTISTATTIIPKEIGEMARRSSDSDLSVTPKGKSDKLNCIL